MPIAVSANQANQNRVSNTFPDVIAKPFYRRLYFGSPPSLGGNSDEGKKAMPQAYLIEQPGDSEVAAHFHDTNQFQVFVHGKGTFGKIPINGLMVHYAKAHTTYGPISAGEDGIHYMTLRNNWDSGAKRMPENRKNLRKIKRSHRLANDIPIPSVHSLQSVTIETSDLILLKEDGLGVRQFNAGPGQEFPISLETNGAGSYVFVVSGSIIHKGVDYETQSLVYRYHDDGPLIVEAGTNGTCVLLLQFPPEPDDE